MYIQGPPKKSVPLVRVVFSVLDPWLYLCTREKNRKGVGIRRQREKFRTLIPVLSGTDINTDLFC